MHIALSNEDLALIRFALYQREIYCSDALSRYSDPAILDRIKSEIDAARKLRQALE